MDLELVTPPADAEILKIVSLAQIKANLRISHTREDDLLKDCIRAAYDWLDGRGKFLNRCILTQTWRVYLPGFQNRLYVEGALSWRNADMLELPLPLSPLQSVTSVRYRKAGVDVTVPATDYEVLKYGLMGRVRCKAPWPVGGDTGENAVCFEVVCGWGDAAAVLERARGIQRGIMLLASDAYHNREDSYADPKLVAVDRRIVNGVMKFVKPYRIVNDHA